MQVDCPQCGYKGQLPDGAEPPPLVQCPQCRNKFPTRPASQATIFCPGCGLKNDDNHFRCTGCGAVLHDTPGPTVVADDLSMGGLIPYKNSHALVAYYLGVFSLIPCVGIPLGLAALGFGISGLKFANRHPAAKGKVHAWIGIVLGGLCAVGYILLIVVPIIIAAMRS